MIAEIPFGEWLPDAPNYKNPGVVDAHNVFPAAGGYVPFRDYQIAPKEADGECRGGRIFERSTGDVVTVGGTRTTLFVISGSVVTETTGLVDIGADGYWQFAQFGRRVLATALNNVVYELSDVDSDTTWTALSDPPSQAKLIGEVSGRMLVANVSGNPYRYEWAALNNPTVWTADAINYNGFAEVSHEFGEITGIVGGRFPKIFQQYGISRINRAGPPTVFQIDTIEEARGAIAPYSIVTVGFEQYFVAHDGFWKTNGAQTFPIGTSRVNKFFRDAVSDSNLFRTHGAVDWRNQSVVWAYYPENSDGFQELLIYSWAQNRWSRATYPLQWLTEGSVPALSIDELDAIYGNIDAVPGSLDSAEFLARNRTLQAFIESATDRTGLVSLDGLPLESTLETGEFQAEPGYRTFIRGVYPIVENMDENTTACVITKNTNGGTEATSDVGTLNAAGYCPVRADGRYARVKVRMSAGANWSKAQGAQVEFERSGRR